MKNSLADLSNHLFTAVEALADDEVLADAERLGREVERAKMMVSLSSQIVQIGRTQLEAARLVAEAGVRRTSLPALLAPKDSDEARTGADVAREAAREAVADAKWKQGIP